MDSQVSQLLLSKRRVAYLITNRNMLITDVGGNSALWSDDRNATKADVLPIGRLLTDLIPHLASRKHTLDEVLLGAELQSQIDYTKDTSGETNTYLRMTTVARRDRAGQIVGLLHVIEDITEVGKMRRQTERLRDRIETLQCQLDIAAHELGTPLTLISGYLELLRETDAENLNAEQQGYLGLVMGNIEHLMFIANDLFDLVYAESGQLRLTPRKVALQPLLEQVAQDMRPMLQEKAQKLLLTADDDLPEVVCDSTRVGQILRNLMSNACSFSPPQGTVELKATMTGDLDFVQITVIDSGFGVHPDESESVFDRFYRTHLADQTSSTGAGLGLYIARILVELHGGRIWCENVADAGAAFSFTLPIKGSTVLPSAPSYLIPESSTVGESKSVVYASPLRHSSYVSHSLNVDVSHLGDAGRLH